MIGAITSFSPGFIVSFSRVKLLNFKALIPQKRNQFLGNEMQKKELKNNVLQQQEHKQGNIDHG